MTEVLPKWDRWDDYDFKYGGHKWSRKGCEFYMIIESSNAVTRLHVGPHRYFEAFTAMKNYNFAYN